MALHFCFDFLKHPLYFPREITLFRGVNRVSNREKGFEQTSGSKRRPKFLKLAKPLQEQSRRAPSYTLLFQIPASKRCINIYFTALIVWSGAMRIPWWTVNLHVRHFQIFPKANVKWLVICSHAHKMLLANCLGQCVRLAKMDDFVFWN